MMAALIKRSPGYLDPTLHNALKLKAFETSRSMSELINEAKGNRLPKMPRTWQPLISYDGMVKRLKKEGRI